jgi:hypothetical protein
VQPEPVEACVHRRYTASSVLLGSDARGTCGTDTATARPAHSIPVACLDAFERVEALERHLRAENKAPATITTYRKACDQLAAFLVARGMLPLRNLEREHIQAFLVDLPDAPAGETGAEPLARRNSFRAPLE